MQVPMSTSIFAVIVVIALTALGFAAAANARRLRAAFYAGLAAWARWLPVAATGLYLAVLAVNLAPKGPGRGHALNLDGLFSMPEVLVLFLIGPLLLTRIGNILAIAAVAYSIERLVARGSDASVALYLVAGAATVVAAIGDKMPWLAAEGAQILAQKVREITLVALTISALGVIAVALFRVHALASWFSALSGWNVSGVAAFGMLTLLIVGWLAIALGLTGAFTLPLLAVPTLLAMAYVTTWPTPLLVVPFALCLALSLASGERRLQSRGRSTNPPASAAIWR